MKAVAIIIGLIVVALAVPCWAGRSDSRTFAPAGVPGDDTLKMALHLVPWTSLKCGQRPVINDFSTINRDWTMTGVGSDFNAFLVMFDWDSLLTFEFGLIWPGEWYFGGFTTCDGATPLGNITGPNEGMALFWGTCQIAAKHGGARPNFWMPWWGVFRPESNGEIEIRDNPTTGDLTVVDCRELAIRKKHWPLTVYHAGVNVDPYEGPPKYATVPTTWGAIKALFQ